MALHAFDRGLKKAFEHVLDPGLNFYFSICGYTLCPLVFGLCLYGVIDAVDEVHEEFLAVLLLAASKKRFIFLETGHGFIDCYRFFEPLACCLQILEDLLGMLYQPLLKAL